jgi:tetratricopeptide (TPR) repeat protein
VAADPLNSWAVGMHAYMLGFAGRHAGAVETGQHAVEIDPGSFFARYTLMQARAWAGEYAEALALGPPLLAISGRHVWGLALMAWLHARLGHGAEATAIHDELSARARHEFVGPLWLALAAAVAGRADEAAREFERAVAERDPVLGVMQFMPHFDLVRALPGFAERFTSLWR